LTSLAIIESLLFSNLLLFFITFSVLMKPDGLVQALVSRYILADDDASYETVIHMVDQLFTLLGILSSALLLSWTVLTAFVVTLYRGGYFWRM